MQIRNSNIFGPIILLCVTLVSATAFAQTPTLSYALEDYFGRLDKRGLELSVSVVDLDGDKPVYALGDQFALSPASVLKLLTSYAALKILGGGYRFPTEVFVDHLPKDLGSAGEQRVDFSTPPTTVGNLYVRGYGDPTFDSDRLSALAQAVRRYGITSLQDIVLDDTLFISPPRATGDLPHEAGLSALTINFNSYEVTMAPGPIGTPAIVSMRAGLPYDLKNLVKTIRGGGSDLDVIQVPSAASSFTGADDPDRQFLLGNAKVQVTAQGTIGHRAAGQTILRSVPDVPEYFATLLKLELEKNGIRLSGKLHRGETPLQAKLLQTIESEDLATILSKLNHFSNNIIAGQLMFALGQDSAGYFRYDNGISTLSTTLESLGVSAGTFELRDASGLDKQNRLSSAQLIKLLSAAYHDFSISPDFIASLSRFGQSGTLKTRTLLDPTLAEQFRGQELLEVRRRVGSVWAKTGTLNNVSSLAGFAETATGIRLAFAIIQNGISDKGRAIQIEDGMLKILLGIVKEDKSGRNIPTPARNSGKPVAIPAPQVPQIAGEPQIPAKPEAKKAEGEAIRREVVVPGAGE